MDRLEFKKIAVIGAGTMGAGIAQHFLQNGLEVTLVEISDEAAQIGKERVYKSLEKGVERGKIAEVDANNIKDQLSITTEYEDLAEVDLVIEAAIENMEIKKQIFATLNEVCKASAILASNTSYLDMNEIALASSRIDKVVGLHFFSPAHIMKLVEVIKTDYVDAGLFDQIKDFINQTGKIGVVSGVCHGFIGNRIYQIYQREAALLMLETRSPLLVDQAMKNFGMAMGPLSVMDMSGIDIGYLMRKALPKDKVHPFAFKVHDGLVESDQKGRKSGKGFYDYGGDAPIVNPAALELIEQIATEHNIAKAELSDVEIAKRCVIAMAEEGDKILAENIAQSSEDIDKVYLYGYGFPKYLGGPMQYRDNA